MKPVLYAIPAFLMLSIVSATSSAYSGSECEVNDCSKPSPTKVKASATNSQPKPKPEVKTVAKDEAKNQAKAKLLDKAPASLRDVTGFFK